MSIFEIVITSVLTVICAACAYRGVFGLAAWKWTRIPFAFVGAFLLSIGMNGVPALPRDEEEEYQNEDEIAEQQVDEPSNEDNEAVKHLWSIRGMTPMDVRNQCVPQAMGTAQVEDEEMDGWDFSDNPKESRAEFIRRKQLEAV